jgi:hypothetical protein
MGGMGGMADAMKDPEVMALLQDPEVMKILTDANLRNQVMAAIASMRFFFLLLFSFCFLCFSLVLEFIFMLTE